MYHLHISFNTSSTVHIPVVFFSRDLQLKMHHHRLRTRRRKRTSSGCHLSQSPKRRRAKRAPSRYPMMPVSDLHPSTLFILRFRAVVHSGWKLRQQTLANWTFCLLVMQTVSYTDIYIRMSTEKSCFTHLKFCENNCRFTLVVVLLKRPPVKAIFILVKFIDYLIS